MADPREPDTRDCVQARGLIYSWSALYQRVHKLRSQTEIATDFVRHGESVANAQGLVTGSWDVPLSDRGYEQAREMGRMLRHRYTYAWSSSLTRSRDTLSLLLDQNNECLVCRCGDPRLDERRLGSLERSKRKLVAEYASGDLEFAPAGGESYLDVTQRVLSFLVDLLELSGKHGGGVRALVSTHAGPLRIVHAIFKGLSNPQEILATDFHNVQVYQVVASRIEWPRFLPSLAELNARSSPPWLHAGGPPVHSQR